MALAEEFGEDSDEDAIDAFTEILVKKELRVSLTRSLLDRCLTYLVLWVNDEDDAVLYAIGRGELPADFISQCQAAILQLTGIQREWGSGPDQ